MKAFLDSYIHERAAWYSGGVLIGAMPSLRATLRPSTWPKLVSTRTGLALIAFGLAAELRAGLETIPDVAIRSGMQLGALALVSFTLFALRGVALEPMPKPARLPTDDTPTTDPGTPAAKAAESKRATDARRNPLEPPR